MDHQQRVFEALQRSKLYREFQVAFEHATGVRVSFEQAGISLSPPCVGLDGAALPLFARKIDWSSSSSSVYGIRENIIVDWVPGIYEAVIPIHIGEQVCGILRTGCMAQPTRNRRQLGQLIMRCRSAGLKKEDGKWVRTLPRVDHQRLSSICKMLLIFGDYLGRLSNQLILQQSTCEPAIVSRAKLFINHNHRESVRLEDVANHVHVCTFYFCKIFKKVTGLTFSDFLMRTRIETAKELLLDSNRRINEVALDAGFQSLTNFNRVFKQVVGESPRNFRKHSAL